MNDPAENVPSAEDLESIRQKLRAVISSKKCNNCGCYQMTVTALENAPEAPRIADLIAEARAAITRLRFDCNGCTICNSAVAYNAFVLAFPGNGANGRESGEK